MKTGLMHRIFLACFLTLAAASASAKAPAQFRFGMDWGYSPQIFSSHASTYKTQMGYRVSEQGRGMTYYANGYALLGAGLEFLDHFGLCLKTGYMGLEKDFRIIPVMGEMHLYTRSYYQCDSPFILLGGGLGFNSSGFDDKTVFTAVGAGYRHNLARKTTIDLVARLQTSHCSPLPVDEYEGIVPRERIIKSFSAQIALSVGLSLYF